MKSIVKFFSIVFTIILIFCFTACRGELQSEDVSKINYTSVSFTEIHKAYKENRAKAENDYVGKYISITGTVYSIISSDYFGIAEYYYTNGIATSWNNMYCKVVDNDLKSKVLEFKEDETVVTVKGKIISLTSMGECSPTIEVYQIIVQ